MNDPIYNKLWNELLTLIPENPTLHHIAYDDQLSDDQVDAVISGGDVYADTDFEDWYHEARWYGAAIYIDEAMDDLRANHDGEDMLADYIDMSEDQLREELYYELCEWDESDTARELAKNTRAVTVEVTLLGEGDADQRSVEDTLKALGFPDTPGNREAMEDLVNNAPTALGMVQAVFTVPVVDLYDGNPDRMFTVHQPYIEYGNLFTGGTWLERFPDVSLTIRQGDMKKNGTTGYSLESVYGIDHLDSEAQYQEEGKAA